MNSAQNNARDKSQSPSPLNGGDMGEGSKMRFKIVLGVIALAILICLSTSLFYSKVQAQQTHAPAVSHDVTVGAQIGEFVANISGFIAPYASVVMTIDDTIVRSTVADANGYFHLSQIEIKNGFDHFCLTAVDVKRLGQSKACFKFTPVSSNYTKTNIFLPPTLGLYKKEIDAGQEALAWGYSMPGATVTLHLSDGRTLTTTADSSGYYEFRPKFKDPGDYELFADASYQKQQSEEPVDKVKLTALSLAGKVGITTEKVGKTIWELLSGPIGFLLLAIPIIILIIILLRKLLQSRKPGLPRTLEHHGPFDFLFRQKKLHHSWYVGY